MGVVLQNFWSKTPKFIDVNTIRSAEHGHSSHYTLQLFDIFWPPVIRQDLQNLVVDCNLVFRAVALEKAVSQLRNVARAVSEGRYRSRKEI
jgi:hypothetical protein